MRNETTGKTGSPGIWIVSASYFVAFSALTCWLYPCMSSDTIFRYAPMADAFARGEWNLAFHPRFGVLFQCVAGSISWLTGLSGDCACQVAATGFLALAAVPLWFLARELFGERVAWWSVAALLVCDDFTRYAMDGLRDVGKCLAFALLGLGAVKERPCWFALGLVVLVSLVSYGFVVGSVLLFGWCVLAIMRRRPGLAVLPVVGWTVATAAVTVMVHAFTGHWLPVPHFIKVVGAWL